MRHARGAPAALSGVGERTLRGRPRRARLPGESLARAHAGGFCAAIVGHAARAFGGLVDAQPAATRAELVEGLRSATGQRPSVNAVALEPPVAASTILHTPRPPPPHGPRPRDGASGVFAADGLK